MGITDGSVNSLGAHADLQAEAMSGSDFYLKTAREDTTRLTIWETLVLGVLHVH